MFYKRIIQNNGQEIPFLVLKFIRNAVGEKDRRSKGLIPFLPVGGGKSSRAENHAEQNKRQRGANPFLIHLIFCCGHVDASPSSPMQKCGRLAKPALFPTR